MKKIIFSFFLFIGILAACTGKQGDQKAVSSGDAPAHAALKKQYTCPMHPQVIKDEPGDCPICGMTLVPVEHSDSRNAALKFTSVQMELANITTMAVSDGSAGHYRVINGRLATDEQRTDIISARVSGRIDRLLIKQTGVLIKKGQPIYALYSEELLTLENEYLLAVDQYRELGQQESRFKAFLDAAEKKLLLYGVTEGQIKLLANSHKVQPRIIMYATAGGVITEVKATEGQYISEGSPIYSLQSLNQLWVEGELYPEEASSMKPGTTIRVLLPGNEDKPLNAAVSFVNPEYQSGSQMVILRATITNPGNLQPGMQVQIGLPPSGHQALAIPLTALFRDAKGSIVFVQTSKNTFVPRMVKTGSENARLVEITEGLRNGETIAGTGAYLIYSEMVLKQGNKAMEGMQM